MNEPTSAQRRDAYFGAREVLRRHCRCCGFAETREVSLAEIATRDRPCPNCGARDWRDRLEIRMGSTRGTSGE